MTGVRAKPAPRIMTRDSFEQEFGRLFLKCDKCNYANHRCHFCGEELTHGSWEVRRIYNHFKWRWEVLLTPHWLSDCRPDLIDGTYDGSEMADGPLG